MLHLKGADGGLSQPAVRISADDVPFVAVLRRGPTVHTLQGGTRVQCVHLGEWAPRQHLAPFMTLLQATTIEASYPEFCTEGVMARWRLLPPRKGSYEPLVELVAVLPDAAQFLAEAAAPENPEWMRRSYQDAWAVRAE